MPNVTVIPAKRRFDVRFELGIADQERLQRALTWSGEKLPLFTRNAVLRNITDLEVRHALRPVN